MNERIAKLYDQAIVIEDGGDYVCGELDIEKFAELIVQEFAELIVQECADICIEMVTKCAGLPGDGALAKDCADWIKKNFGVDE